MYENLLYFGLVRLTNIVIQIQKITSLCLKNRNNYRNIPRKLITNTSNPSLLIWWLCSNIYKQNFFAVVSWHWYSMKSPQLCYLYQETDLIRILSHGLCGKHCGQHYGEQRQWAVKWVVSGGNGYLRVGDVIYLNLNKAFDSLQQYPGCGAGYVRTDQDNDKMNGKWAGPQGSRNSKQRVKVGILSNH